MIASLTYIVVVHALVKPVNTTHVLNVIINDWMC